MYEIPIPLDLYRKLNKDSTLKKYFTSSSVGKCMKLIDDYYSNTDTFSQMGWENYYLTKKRADKLNEIYNELIKLLTNLSKEDIRDYIFHRVIGQTYNGFLNELNIINKLQDEFPQLDFIKATYELDEQYFTDFEAYYNGELVLGGQIKPISYYYMNTPYQIRAKENHEAQRQKYISTFKAPHLLLFYMGDGSLYEQQKIFDKINIILVIENNLK